MRRMSCPIREFVSTRSCLSLRDQHPAVHGHAARELVSAGFGRRHFDGGLLSRWYELPDTEVGQHDFVGARAGVASIEHETEGTAGAQSDSRGAVPTVDHDNLLGTG